MSRIDSTLAKFRRAPTAGRSDNPFRLVSSVSAPAMPGEVEAAWHGLVVPADAAGLWSACRSARLFEDADYGQWGLVLLDPRASAQRTTQERASRPGDFGSEDVVIGEFLGDQELLVIAPSENRQRRILIALPLDARSEWFGAAADLVEFLDTYFDAGGDKFWVRHGA